MDFSRSVTRKCHFAGQTLELPLVPADDGALIGGAMAAAAATLGAMAVPTLMALAKALGAW